MHIVHIYVVEPHPEAPDPSPYGGNARPAEHSDGRPMPMTYPERVSYARDTAALLTGQQLLLVDDLTPGTRDNPLWCSYGTCPNCAFLIAQDGQLQRVQTWLNVDEMQAAIDLLLSGP